MQATDKKISKSALLKFKNRQWYVTVEKAALDFSDPNISLYIE